MPCTNNRDVLREINRQIFDRGLPAPSDIRITDETINLHWDRAEDLDAWARELKVTPKPVVHEDTWQYAAHRWDELWMDRSVHLLVIHRIPAGDDLITDQTAVNR